MASNQKTGIPTVPIRTPFFDAPKDTDFEASGIENWHLNRTWIIFFERLAKLYDELSILAGNLPGAGYDKATFGLVAPLILGTGLTNYYVSRSEGDFVDCVVKIRTAPPTGQNAIFDILISNDDGASWSSIFPAGNANKINLAAGSVAETVVSTFAITGITVNSLLRIDCLQVGSGNPGQGVQVVLRWTTDAPVATTTPSNPPSGVFPRDFAHVAHEFLDSFTAGTGLFTASQPADVDLALSDVTTNNVSSARHGFAPKSPADATQFQNGAATPAYAQVKDSDLSTSDITTNNVSISKHGFAPKAPNDATKYLDGTGAYTVPAGGGGGGGLVLLEQHTASASAELDFTTAISATYDEYIIEIVDLVPSAAAIIGIQMSTNGGVSYDTGSNYDWGAVYGFSGGSGAIGSSSDTRIKFRDAATTVPANYPGFCGHLRLFSPGGALFKAVLGQISIGFSNVNSLLVVNLNGAYHSTTAVNAFRILPDAGNLASGVVRVYGVAK